MTAGVQIFRPDGTTQIDDKYRVMSLNSVYVQSVTSGDNITISATGSNVMVAVRSESLEVTTLRIRRSGTSWTSVFNFQSSSPVVENVKFYIFSEPVPQPGAYFEIYDQAGNLCFGQFSKPIRVVAQVAGNSDFFGTSGRIYAPIFLTRFEHNITLNGGISYLYRYGYLRCSGSSIIYSLRQVSSGNARRSPVGATYLVADVTDY